MHQGLWTFKDSSFLWINFWQSIDSLANRRCKQMRQCRRAVNTSKFYCSLNSFQSEFLKLPPPFFRSLPPFEFNLSVWPLTLRRRCLLLIEKQLYFHISDCILEHIYIIFIYSAVLMLDILFYV
jgi:hypothetical protein